MKSYRLRMPVCIVLDIGKARVYTQSPRSSELLLEMSRDVQRLVRSHTPSATTTFQRNVWLINDDLRGMR